MTGAPKLKMGTWPWPWPLEGILSSKANTWYGTKIWRL